MRKWFGGLLMLILLLCASMAFAEGQTDPTRQQMLESLRQKQMAKEGILQLPRDDLLFGSTEIDVSISGTRQPCKTLTFQAKVSGVSDTESLEYHWGISDEGRDPYGYIYYPQHDDLKEKKKISYKFYSAGTYSVYLYVTRNGSYVGYFFDEFTIQDDGVHPTLEEKAQSIVNSCKGSDSWHTALNLYDWLTHHAYYDETLDTHGADILFLGYGVCDSYSKAYELLCRTAGIPVERTFGPNHAWNALKLEGKWYQADPTWDDPGWAMPGEGSAVSGYEGHAFFCVSAAAMIPVDSHSYAEGIQEGEHAAQCTSMDANYFIHENLWSSFGEWDWDSASGNAYVSTYISQIQNAFENGADGFEKTIEEYVYFLEGGNMTGESFYPSILREILKTGMPKQSFAWDGELVRVKISLSDHLVLTAKISGWFITETGTLTLPGSLKTVSPQAFYRHRATKAVLPQGCATIGSKAFAYSAVRTVVIPGPVSSIAGDAFEGCGRIMFISSDEKVRIFAAEHGFLTVNP